MEGGVENYQWRAMKRNNGNAKLEVKVDGERGSCIAFPPNGENKNASSNSRRLFRLQVVVRMKQRPFGVPFNRVLVFGYHAHG